MNRGASTRTFTVSGASIANLVAYASARGANLTPTLEELGLSGVDLMAPERRVELPASQKLWERAAAELSDPELGLHYAERLDLDAFHVLGHLAQTSRTFGEALERIVAYSRLLHDAGRTELERRTGGEVALFPGCRGLPVRPARPVAEFNTAAAVVLARIITEATALAPVEVCFEHPAPPNLREHRRVLGLTPRFSCAESYLVFSAATLRLPVKNRTPSELGRYLEGYARRLLDALPTVEQELDTQVLRALITALPSGAPSIETVATRFAMSPRTLQRRLAERRSSFAELLERARIALAERYLEDRALPLTEIAFLLGFKDPTTFHKAFRRWKGVTPGQWRERTG